MGLFNFLKNIFSEENTQNNDPKQKDIFSNNIDSTISNELVDVYKRKALIKNALTKEVDELNLLLSEQIPILTKIDISERKEMEKIKIIVMDNLKQYLSQLEKLRIELKEAENENPSTYSNQIHQIFLSFNKNSKTCLDKSTILIGKEFEPVKNSIKEFSKSYNEIILSHKDAIETEPVLIELKNLLNKKTELIKIKQDSENQSKNITEKIKVFGKNITEKEKNIENIKKGQEYLNFLEDKEKIKKDKNNLNQKIMELKEKIDIKLLAKYFHNDAKKSKIISNYTDNFISSLENDKGMQIINLIKETKPELNIEEELKKLKLKNESLKESKESEVEVELRLAEEELANLKNKTKDYEEELKKEERKIEKFNEKTEMIENEVKEKAKILGWNII